MPGPHTGETQPGGTPLWAFDNAGNLYTAGGVWPYGALTPDGATVTTPPWPAPHGDVLAGAAECTLPRNIAAVAAVALASGTIALSYWTAQKSATSYSVITQSSSTAASGLTGAWVGVYASDLRGNLTLQAVTANTTSLWAATYTPYTTAWAAPFTRAAGQRYALAVLAVGTTPPTMAGTNTTYGNASPPLCTQLAGQASLPPAIPAGSLAYTAYTQVIGIVQ